MVIRALVIGGVVLFCLYNGYYYAALFILAGGIFHYVGWILLVFGCGILFYEREWIVGAIPLLWAFVWEMWGPKLIGMKSIPEELRELRGIRKQTPKFSAVLRSPGECSVSELDTFENLVKVGGEVNPQGLRNRIENAHFLACAVTSGGEVVGVAALKNPHEHYRSSVFQKARSKENPNQWQYELGWIFVKDEYRKQGVATQLVESLFSGSNSASIYATARENNDPILPILKKFGFVQSGEAYSSNEDSYSLVLYIKPA